MTSHARTHHRPLGLNAIFGGIGAKLTRYRTYRNTLDELSQLSERDLADLGIHRSQVRAIAYEAAYRG